MQRRIAPRPAAPAFRWSIRPSFTLGGTGGGIAYNPRRVRGDLQARPRPLADQRAPDRGEPDRLEGVRDGGRPRQGGQLHHRLLDREPRPDGHPHRRLDHGRAGADADGQGIPADAQRLDRDPARDRRRDRRLERAVRGQPEGRPDGRHRDEPARLALVGAGVEGDRLSDRQGRRQAGRRLHARRAEERHHRRRDAGELRAVDRLRRHQDPALRVREVPGRRFAPDDADEVGRRGDGDRPHLPGEPAEGAARPRDRHRRLRPTRSTDREEIVQEIGEAGPGAAALRRRRVPHRHERSTRSSRRRRSTRGSSRRSRRSSRPSARSTGARWRACRRDELRYLKAQGLLRPPPRRACSAADEDEVRARAPRARRAAGLQARRHLRRRVRDRRPRTCTRPTTRSARPSRPTARRSWSSAAARTGSARASSSTTAASTPRSRCARTATRRSWSTATRRPSRPTTTPRTASTSSR